MPLMADQFAIKVHFYSCLLLFVWSAIVIGRSAAAAATTANDTDHNDYNSSSSKGSYDNITTSLRVESARPTLTQSFTSALPTSSSPQPMRLTNVSAIDKVVPMSDITATRDLHPPHTSTTISLSKNFKFTHQAKELDVGKSSTKPGLTNLTEMASILSENTTKNENEDKMNTVQTASNSSNEVDKKPFPLKRHLTRSPSEDASHPDQSDGKQTEEAVFYANTTSNNEIHDFHPSNFSDGISLNSSVENNFNIPIVAANSSSFRRDNCTNQDPSELTKNRAVEKSEKPTDARNATVQKYPPSPLSSGTSLTPETINVSVTENYGNPTPSVHSTFDSQTPSLATKFATTATTTATTTTTTTPIATIATTTIPTTTEFNGQERTFEQSAERHTSLSQFRSSERLFNVDDKRYEAVTILLLASANETVESLNKSVRKLEHKNDSRHERANDTDLQESDSLDGATYDESRELKRASAEKKAIDDADDRSDMTTRRRRRKNARRRKEKHIPFVPAEVTTTEPFPTRRHHHRYHPDNHRQQIIPPTGESSFSAEDSGDRRNVNSGRNKDRQRRPGRRERARTRDDPSLDIGRKQQQRNRLESPRHEGDNSLAVLSSAESGDEEEAYKYSSSPLALPPLRNRDPKRQRSPLPSYVHKRSPSGSFESNEIKPQTSSKRFTFSDCGEIVIDDHSLLKLAIEVDVGPFCKLFMRLMKYEIMKFNSIVIVVTKIYLKK